MAVIVWLTHKFQYQASVTALSSMRSFAGSDHQKLSHPRIKDELNLWPSIFTGHTFIINRPTPIHRDSNGFKAGFDYLTVSGTAKATLSLPDLNGTCLYNPGTVVALAGRVFRHGADQAHASDCARLDESGRATCVCADRVGGTDCICRDRVEGGNCDCADTVGGGDRVCTARWVRQRVLLEFGMVGEDDLPWSTVAAVEERMRMCFSPKPECA
jgi:hypothetical protein